MAANIFSEKHQILFYETDRTRRVTPGMLVNILMLASQDQSDELGLTSQKIHAQDLGWVVTQHLLTIERLPQLKEKVIVKTQATAYNHYFCYRDFWLEDQTGEVLAKMHSTFILMDQEKRKITKVPTELIAPYGSEYTPKVERVAEPEKFNLEKMSASKDYRVRFMDIDANQHVNNVHYFDWIVDALSEEFLINHQIKQVNVRYKREVHYGELVTSRVDQPLTVKDSKMSITHHQIVVDQQESCRAQCLWEKNENQ
ncbi:MAG: acyl-ACP thioesterase domain-containing protein [Liquorilactobacillus nagelii]|uniref:acyl-[acyl-carrier-protein] thioesterase n=2 Tax=Liquorilactobacillus nagelii TaxID=82688 RepID=UPI0039E81724